MPSTKYRSGQWAVLNWETALPSRIEVKLPADLGEQVETARKRIIASAKFSDALERVRARIDREPVEREELRRLCWDLHIPGDFDVAQINWRPDYDAFFYRHLCRKARRLYLFRGEYILELPMAIAVETPQLGNATYVSRGRRTWRPSLQRIPGSPRRTSAKIAKTQQRSWDSWGALCTAQILAPGSKS